MNTFYWWSRYGNFSPGIGILPHMGEVITHYRKKRYNNQDQFAIAADCKLRSVQEWESAIMTRDHDRRIFLSKLLNIPPALLGLDWRLVTYQDTTGNPTDFFPNMVERIEEDAYYQFEDILVLGWECVHNGKALEIAPRIERRLRKLVEITKNASALDREAWQYLLCQFYQLHTHITRHHGINLTNKQKVFQGNTEAVRIARDLDDVRLLAATLFRGSEISLEYDDYNLAKKTIQGALDRIDQVSTPLKVTICLFAANANAVFTENDASLERDVQRWLDTALNLVHKGEIEDDGNFLKPNLAAVHHEKAKTYMKFHNLHPLNPQYLKDARHELILAWKGLRPDMVEWRMNFFFTEAQLYFAEHDIEGCAKSAIEAAKQARFMHSTKGIEQGLILYSQLKEHGKINSYIDSLGVQLGIFS